MTHLGKTHDEAILKQINNHLQQVRPKERGWEGKLESLKSFIFEVIEEDDRDIQIKIGFFEKSIEDLKKRFSSSMSKHQEINMDIWLGDCFEKFGAWDKASSAYQKAMNFCDSKTEGNLQSEALMSLGNIYMMQNQWKKASDSYKESLKLCQSTGDQEREAYTYNSLGIFYFEKGELGEASKYWEEGLGLAEKLNENKLTAQIYNNLGALMSTLGNWEKALTYFNKSGILFEKMGEFRGLAETYHNMGMTFADDKHWSESGEYYEKSYEIAKKIGDVRLQAMVKLNRVELYMSINDIYAGLALCNQALQTFVQLDDHLGEAETYKFIGILYTKTQEWDFASSYFDDCIHLAKQYKNPLLEGEAYFEYGVMQKEKNDKEKAIQYFNAALPLFESLKAEKDIGKVKEALNSISK